MDHTDLQAQYDGMWRDTQRVVAASGFQWDEQIGSPDDTRYGITLRLRPSPEVRHRITALLAEFNALEPGHHVYLETEIHVTVLSLLTCRPRFALDRADVLQRLRRIGVLQTVEQLLPEDGPFAEQTHPLQHQDGHADEEQRRGDVLQRMAAEVTDRHLPLHGQKRNQLIEADAEQSAPQDG